MKLFFTIALFAALQACTSSQQPPEMIFVQGERVPASVPSFWITHHEINSAQWQSFSQSTGRSVPDLADENSAVQVSWKEANAYCAWLSQQTGAKYRLPTESEWRLASRKVPNLTDASNGFRVVRSL
jgi:formylglycine-generating enzyme required for sulfatase activity